ncbi:hypothetical protein J7T55_007152, partial [Diaporthe amygdali]|uniref:uncharacterized protein n=1 Tax=Phomopsis amygdali TaxID=1214568 RepID=UPI0022FE64CF
MMFPTISLAAKDGYQFDVSILVLYESRILKTMIDCLGRDKIEGKVVPLEVEGEALQKVINWIEYHLDNALPDRDEVRKGGSFDSRSLDEERTKEMEDRENIIQVKKEELKELEYLEGIEEHEKAEELEDISAWSRWNKDWRVKTKEKEQEIRELEKGLFERELYHQERKQIAKGEASKAALRAHDEAAGRVRKWESSFMEIDTPLLFKVIQAANYLEISNILNSSCSNAADRIKGGLLKSLDGLPNEIHLQIAEHLLPCALLKAAKAGIVNLTRDQEFYAQKWTRIFRCDTWFEAAMKAKAWPMLVASDMKHQSYLILASLDWTGDLRYKLPTGKTIHDYLQPGRYESDDYHLDDGLVVRITEVGHCDIRNMEETFVHTREDGSWELSVMYLKDPKVHKLVCKEPRKNSG